MRDASRQQNPASQNVTSLQQHASARKGAKEGAAGEKSPRDRAGKNGSPDWLGRSLRRLYQSTVNEPIPDKLRSLLDQLDRQDTTQSEDTTDKTERS